MDSGLHHLSLFLAEAPNISPRPSQMPLCFQSWVLVNRLPTRQPKEKRTGVGHSGKAQSCLQPCLAFGSTTACPCGYGTVGCRRCTVIFVMGYQGKQKAGDTRSCLLPDRVFRQACARHGAAEEMSQWLPSSRVIAPHG